MGNEGPTISHTRAIAWQRVFRFFRLYCIKFVWGCPQGSIMGPLLFKFQWFGGHQGFWCSLLSRLGRSCAKRAQNIDKSNCLIIVGDRAELVNKHYNLPDGVFALSSGGGCGSLEGATQKPACMDLTFRWFDILLLTPICVPADLWHALVIVNNGISGHFIIACI